MGSSSPTPGSVPALQPGERVSGPLPSLPLGAAVTAAPTSLQASTPTPRQPRLGSLLAVIGSLLTLFGFFLPTYLALPLLNIASYSDNPYIGSLYITPENAKITGMQILVLQTSFGGFFSSTGFTLLLLQGVVFAAVINTLSLISTRMRKFSLRSGTLLGGAFLFLACLGMYIMFYVLAVTIPLLISLSLSAKRSDHVRAWLRMAWPVIGIGALIASTAYFFSTMADVLPQVTGPTAYRYDYFASVGPGAWLSLAGLLTTLLGGVLEFQARKQAAAVP